MNVIQLFNGIVLDLLNYIYKYMLIHGADGVFLVCIPTALLHTSYSVFAIAWV